MSSAASLLLSAFLDGPDETYSPHPFRTFADAQMAKSWLEDKSARRRARAKFLVTAQFPDANLRSNDQLKNFFATKTDAGSAVLTLVSGTFKTLCDNSDFSATPTILPGPESGQVEVKATNRILPAMRLQPAGVTVNLNIQLPATENASVYNNIFRSLRENLIDPKPSDSD